MFGTEAVVDDDDDVETDAEQEMSIIDSGDKESAILSFGMKELGKESKRSCCC